MDSTTSLTDDDDDYSESETESDSSSSSERLTLHKRKKKKRSIMNWSMKRADDVYSEQRVEIKNIGSITQT